MGGGSRVVGARPGGQRRAAGSPRTGGVGRPAGRHFGAVSARPAAWSPCGEAVAAGGRAEEGQERAAEGVAAESLAWSAGSSPFLRHSGRWGPHRLLAGLFYFSHVFL